MSRKKELPKPLFPLKNDFVAALDNYVQQATNLNGLVRMILPTLPGPLADRMREASEALDAAHSSMGGDDE
jgi:hypothetical protein